MLVDIQSIVEKARRDFENKDLDIELLKKLYQEYNPLDAIDEFIQTALAQFPKLNCGLASVYLKHLLGGEIIKGTYENEPHTFLKIENTIIDVTADQYGGQKVYIGNVAKPWGIL